MHQNYHNFDLCFHRTYLNRENDLSVIDVAKGRLFDQSNLLAKLPRNQTLNARNFSHGYLNNRFGIRRMNTQILFIL